MDDQIPLMAIKVITNLNKMNLLFGAPSKDGYEKVILTDVGAVIISLAVEFCVQSGKTPDCAINGDGSAASSDIISLSKLELKDLIRKLNLIYSLNAKAFDPSRN